MRVVSTSRDLPEGIDEGNLSRIPINWTACATRRGRARDLSVS
jgi:hypothetical protein